MPALVVDGTADLLTTPRDARRLARGLAGARLELVPGAGHMLMLERAERFGALAVAASPASSGSAAGLARRDHRRRRAFASGTGPATRTGVTVVLLPPGTVGSGEVRGGAPATRELALLEATRTVEQVDAVVFTGGSAFGLATADGVMHHLAAQGRGRAHARRAGADRAQRPRSSTSRVDGGDAPGPRRRARPRPRRREPEPASTLGRVGAGRGARVGMWRGRRPRGGGRPRAARARGSTAATVGALAVVNAVGDVIDARRRASSPARPRPRTAPAFPEPTRTSGEHTTLVLRRHRRPLHEGRTASCSPRAATTAWPGRSHPSHTRFDGDLVVAVATGVVEAHLDRLRVAATEVVAEAVRSAVRAN